MRRIVGILAILCIGLASGLPRPAEARTETAELRFDELYGSVGVLGMEFSAKVRALEGKRVRIRGFSQYFSHNKRYHNFHQNLADNNYRR